MEFWGVVVKVGESLQCSPGEENVVHISQACLGEKKKDKGNETVYIYIKIKDKKFVIGTLSHDQFPQVALDLVCEKEFELSHTGKNAYVHFTGYKVATEDETHDSGSEEEAPVAAHTVVGIPASQASLAKKADAKEKKGSVIENKDLDDSDESDDELTNGDDDDDESGDEDDTTDSDEEEEDSDEEETPKKVEPAVKKRAADSAAKTPAPDKKAKFVSPQKSDGKKAVSVHVATPYPTKKSEKKSSAISTSSDQKKDAIPKGSVMCTTCSRTFGTDKALESHSKAKHGST